MANNCGNYIEVEGDSKQIKELYEFLSQHLLDDEKGTDGGFLDLIKLTKYKDGDDIYELAGTKWFDVFLDLHDDFLFITGDSAWSPPLQLMQKLSVRFDKLYFKHDYEEPGWDFGGMAEMHNGNIQDEVFTYWEYRFKRDWELACHNAYDELSDIIENGRDEELEGHHFIEHMGIEEFNKMVDEIKQQAGK